MQLWLHCPCSINDSIGTLTNTTFLFILCQSWNQTGWLNRIPSTRHHDHPTAKVLRPYCYDSNHEEDVIAGEVWGRQELWLEFRYNRAVLMFDSTRQHSTDVRCWPLKSGTSSHTTHLANHHTEWCNLRNNSRFLQPFLAWFSVKTRLVHFYVWMLILPASTQKWFCKVLKPIRKRRPCHLA